MVAKAVIGGMESRYDVGLRTLLTMLYRWAFVFFIICRLSSRTLQRNFRFPENTLVDEFRKRSP